MSDTSLVFNLIAKDKASAVWGRMKGTAAAAGLAIGAALAAGVAGAVEKSKTDALLAAQLGAGPVFSKNLGKLSGSMYAQGFGEDIAGVNAALKATFQNGLAGPKMAQKDVEAVTAKVMNLATVMEEDAERVSTTVSQMVRTGMVKSATEAFDLLHKGSELGVNKAQDLLDTYNEYGTQFRKLGLDGPRALGLLNQAIRAGARDSDQAADALKEFSIRAVDGSKASADGYKALGLNAGQMTAMMAKGGAGAAKGLDVVLDRLRAMKDPVKQNAAAVALFGTQSEDLGKALFAMDASKATASLGAVAGSAKRAGDALGGSAGASLDTFKRKLQMALVDKMAEALPAIQSTFGFLSSHEGAVTRVALAMGGLTVAVLAVSAAQKVWAASQAVVTAATAAWTAVQGVATGTLGTWIGVQALAFAAWVRSAAATATATAATVANTVAALASRVGTLAWAAAQWALNLAQMASPLGWIVLGIVALVAVVVLAYNKVGWFRAGVQAAFAGIVLSLKWMWAGIKWLWDKTVAAWHAIAAGAVWLKNVVIAGFMLWLRFVTSIPGRIRSLASGMFDGIKNAFRAAINWIIGRWNGLSFGIPKITVAGFSFGGQSFRVPQIPYLDGGGDITGSGLAFVHQGERVTPAARVAPLGSRGGGTERIVLELRTNDPLLEQILSGLQHRISSRFRGNVQLALGKSG